MLDRTCFYLGKHSTTEHTSSPISLLRHRWFPELETAGYTPASIPVLWRQRQGCEFEFSLGWCTVGKRMKKKKKKPNKPTINSCLLRETQPVKFNGLIYLLLLHFLLLFRYIYNTTLHQRHREHCRTQGRKTVRMRGLGSLWWDCLLNITGEVHPWNLTITAA